MQPAGRPRRQKAELKQPKKQPQQPQPPRRRLAAAASPPRRPTPMRRCRRLWQLHWAAAAASLDWTICFPREAPRCALAAPQWATPRQWLHRRRKAAVPRASARPAAACAVSLAGCRTAGGRASLLRLNQLRSQPGHRQQAHRLLDRRGWAAAQAHHLLLLPPLARRAVRRRRSWRRRRRGWRLWSRSLQTASARTRCETGPLPCSRKRLLSCGEAGKGCFERDAVGLEPPAAPCCTCALACIRLLPVRAPSAASVGSQASRGPTQSVPVTPTPTGAKRSAGMWT